MKRTEKMPNELLRYERERRNWSRVSLAQKLDLPDEDMLKRWELGDHQPSPHYRQKLTDLFRRSAQELGFVRKGEVAFWNIPYSRNLYFTGREDILSQIYTHFASNNDTRQPLVLCGLGGIGKTQTAVEYAYRYREHYHTVLWVKSGTPEDLFSGMVALAHELNLPEKDAKDQQQAIHAVKRWFSEVALTRWLLIFDNVDDLKIALDFLPQSFLGNILLTTRRHVTGRLAERVELVEMEPGVGAYFLLRRAKVLPVQTPVEQVPQTQFAEAEAIAKALGGLPLALEQAGAYIEETRCGIAEYNNLFQSRQLELLQRPGQFSSDYAETVSTTWSLSFQKIEQENSVAADLLRACAFLAPDALPEELFTDGGSELGLVLQTVAADPLIFNNALEDLMKFSLVRRNRETKMLTVHRLVQTVLKGAMQPEVQAIWAERVVRCVGRAFPDISFETWPICERYVPHALECSSLIEKYKLTFPEAVQLLSKAGYYLQERARFTEAERLFKIAFHIQEQWGTEHLDIASDLLFNLARLQHTRGRYQEADLLYQQALTICKSIYDFEHPQIANCFNNLGALYWMWGKYDQALDFYQQALTIRQALYGLSNVDVAASIGNIAIVYFYQGEYSLAESFYQQALEVLEKLLGQIHPTIANNLDNRAVNYSKQEKYEQAEPLFRRALEMREKIYGLDHPFIANSLDNLAIFYIQQKKYQQAEPLLDRALAIREQMQGYDNPTVATSLDNLATIYMEQEKYEQAELLLNRALMLREREWGPEHPFLGSTLEGLASLYEKQENYEQAECFYQRSLELREHGQNLDPLDLAHCLESYANLLRTLKREDEAIALEIRAKAIRDKQT